MEQFPTKRKLKLTSLHLRKHAPEKLPSRSTRVSANLAKGKEVSDRDEALLQMLQVQDPDLKTEMCFPPGFPDASEAREVSCGTTGVVFGFL